MSFFSSNCILIMAKFCPEIGVTGVSNTPKYCQKAPQYIAPPWYLPPKTRCLWCRAWKERLVSFGIIGGEMLWKQAHLVSLPLSHPPQLHHHHYDMANAVPRLLFSVIFLLSSDCVCSKRKPVFRRAILYFFYMVWTVLVSSPLRHEFLNNY